jgi:GH25 family lysozyme M1 (1,4-beta-N-acetylmuramidase)
MMRIKHSFNHNTKETLNQLNLSTHLLETEMTGLYIYIYIYIRWAADAYRWTTWLLITISHEVIARMDRERNCS